MSQSSNTTRSLKSSIQRYSPYPSVDVVDWLGYHMLGKNLVEVFTVDEFLEAGIKPTLLVYDGAKRMAQGFLYPDVFLGLEGDKLVGFDKSAKQFVGLLNVEEDAIAAIDEVFFIGTFTADGKNFQFVRGDRDFAWGEVLVA
jgi:hypothetical protein